MTCTNCKNRKAAANTAGQTLKMNVQRLIENIKKQRVKGDKNGKT